MADTRKRLVTVLSEIDGTFHNGTICAEGERYLFFDIANFSANLGFEDVAELCKGVKVAIPLTRPIVKMVGVEVDGRELSDHCQLDSGIIVPKFIAEKSGLPHTKYQPKNTMIRYEV